MKPTKTYLKVFFTLLFAETVFMIAAGYFEINAITAIVIGGFLLVYMSGKSIYRKVIRNE